MDPAKVIAKLANERFEVSDDVQSIDWSYRTGWNHAMERATSILREQTGASAAALALAAAVESAGRLHDALSSLLGSFPELGKSYASPQQQVALSEARELIG